MNDLEKKDPPFPSEALKEFAMVRALTIVREIRKVRNAHLAELAGLPEPEESKAELTKDELSLARMFFATYVGAILDEREGKAPR